MKEENENNVEMIDIHNSDSEGDVDPLHQYTIEYLDCNQKGENDSNNDESFEDKGYRTFLVADYVEYCKNTNMSKCLIRNCERAMSGRRTGNIKRHYHKVHKLVIVHNNKPSEKITVVTGQQPCITVNLNKYFDYDPLMDKSRCKVPGCNTALAGRKPNNIMRHYSLVHNFKIEPTTTNECNEPHNSLPECKEQIPNAPSITIDELVTFDAETSTNQCLFVTCNQILEKELSFIERHYNEVHKVVIARASDNIPNRFYRKRLYRYIQQPFENDQEYVNNKLHEYINQTATSYIKHELLSDDEQQPHGSKELIETISNLQIPLGKKGFGKFHLAKYVDYDKNKKISKCMIKHCRRSMSGCFVGNIKRHYLTIHNFVILHGTRIPFEEIEEMSDVTGDQINDLVTYDKSSSHQCLFINCNYILEENLSTIKRHYLEVHKIIIVRYNDYVAQKKRRYRDMQQSYENELPDDESGSVGNEFLSDDDKRLNEEQSSADKIKYGKLIIDNYVDYQKDKNISKCLIKQCKRSMSGCFVGNIKRHYLTIHKFIILHGNRLPYKDIEEISNATGQQSDTIIDDLVPYDIDTSSYQCLFTNCNQILPKHLPTIYKHYHDIHKVIIAKDTDKITASGFHSESIYGEIYHQTNESEFPDDEFYSINHEFLSDDEQPQCSKKLNEPHNRQLLNLGKMGSGKFIFANYVQHEKDKNSSQCLIKHCKRTMSGCIVGNIKRHYKRIHNFIILHGLRMPFEEFDDICDNVIVDDLLAYDIDTSTYQCIFINCNEVLEKHLPTIKRHYCNIHKVILARDSEHAVQRKRKYREIYETHENEFLEEESCSVRNEFLSDDEKPHCSKRSKMNLTDNADESENCFIKKEYISEEEEEKPQNYLALYKNDTVSHTIKKECTSNYQPPVSKHSLKESLEKAETTSIAKPNLQKKSTSIDITLNKQTFLQLCLGLVIERDLPLKLFDDEKYFKPLLASYEQAFDCVINASVIQGIILKANNIIVDNLKKTFNNKIVCLELYVLKRENNLYMVINVRFLEEQTICNKLIGFLPINETTKILPISACLSKFNIDEQQVYMKTIMADLQEDEETYKICNNLCKYNTDLKNNPIYDLQTILRSFVQKYTEDIKTWQALAEYQDNTNKDMKTSFKEFALFLENCSKTDQKLQEAKCCFKALRILWNFMEKLDGKQYVAGDFYRDWLCCELGLKGEQTKHSNAYAAELYEDLCESKNKLLESNEFLAALYLDARFNFLGSHLLNDTQKSKGKLFLCDIWEKFNNFLPTVYSNNDTLPKSLPDPDNSNDDDEYALLTQHINDTMPVKSNVSIQHKLLNFVPTQRQPISMDILKYWHCNRQFMEEVNDLTKIVFTHSASRYISVHLQTNFTVPSKHIDQYDKFLIQSNQSILEKNTDFN